MTLTPEQRRKKLWAARKYRLGVDYLRVDAAPSAAEVARWIAMGYTVPHVAHVVSTDPANLRLIQDGTTKKTDLVLAQRISQLTHHQLLAEAPERCQLPTVGTRRRFRALQAMGWTSTDIGVRAWYVFKGTHIRPVTFRTVHDAYSRLSMTPGPSDRNRVLAKRDGWLPPLAWDDEDIDDPDGTPRNGPNRRDYHEDRVAEVWRLTRAGLFERVIAERLGISERSVTRIKARTKEAAA